MIDTGGQEGGVSFPYSYPIIVYPSLFYPNFLYIKFSGFKLDVIIKHAASILLTIFLIYELFLLENFDATHLRVVVTFTIGLLLLSGFAAQTFLLTNKMFLYIGDISYVLYLVHWPIMMFIRYFSSSTKFDLKGNFYFFKATLQ